MRDDGSSRGAASSLEVSLRSRSSERSTLTAARQTIPPFATATGLSSEGFNGGACETRAPLDGLHSDGQKGEEEEDGLVALRR